jgi:hypothetical protein
MSTGNEAAVGRENPAVGALAINYSIDQTFASQGRPVRGIYVAVTGTLKVDMADGTTGVSFANLAAGVIYPIAITKIYSIGSSGVTGLVLF